MRQRFILLLLIFGLAWMIALGQTGVTADIINQANLRARPDVSADKVGEVFSGTSYSVLGRSEFFPWVLLGDPVTLQPIGWVFQDLVQIRGDLFSVPISTSVIGANVPTATPTASPQSVTLAITTPSNTIINTPTATPQPFTVAGMTRGEVNVRYGPSIQYDRLGVALAGERFQITGYHTQYPWVQIAYDRSPTGRAWIAIDLLDIEGNIYSLPAITDAVLNLPTLTPTPAVVSSSAVNGLSVTLSPQFESLGNELWGLVLNAGFDPQTSRFGSLFVMDLQTREAFAFGTDFAFSGTSINKIAIMMTLYGFLDAPPTASMAVDIANTMICSENVATNRLLSMVGGGDPFAGAQQVTTLFNRLNLTHSFILSPYITDPNNPLVPPYPLRVPDTGIDQEKANPDFSNQLTVEDMGALLVSLYDCAYGESSALQSAFPDDYEPRECRQMLHVMSNNNVDALLKAGVPANTRVAHKHGWIEDTHGNAAVFFTPGGDYVIVMMLHQPTWLEYTTSLPVIAEVSRRVYNYFNPDTPMQSIRDGFIPDAPTCNFAGTPLIEDLRLPIWND